MDFRIIHIEETDSTNRWLKENGEGNMVVVADYQTAGKGCGTNSWESERGKNLTFSMLIHPENIPASRQFRITEIISVAICEVLEQYIGDVSIKWPNDIYWRNGKLGGILIENALTGNQIRDCIIGVGLNVNQRRFLSGAPNPVSLWQISEHETDCAQLLDEILAKFGELVGQDVRPGSGWGVYGRVDRCGGRRASAVARRQWPSASLRLQRSNVYNLMFNIKVYGKI